MIEESIGGTGGMNVWDKSVGGWVNKIYWKVDFLGYSII